MILSKQLNILKMMTENAEGVKAAFGDDPHNLLDQPLCALLYQGICNKVASVHRREVLRPLISKWEYYSGDRVYPVPSPDMSKFSSSVVFFEYPLWEGAYGGKRYELLVYLLEQLYKLLVLTILTQLQEIPRGRRDNSISICGYLDLVISSELTRGRGETLLNKLFSDWKHFSGDIEFPVPSGGIKGACTAFCTLPLWGTGAYGDYRCDLLKYTITELQNSLN